MIIVHQNWRVYIHNWKYVIYNEKIYGLVRKFIIKSRVTQVSIHNVFCKYTINTLLLDFYTQNNDKIVHKIINTCSFLPIRWPDFFCHMVKKRVRLFFMYISPFANRHFIFMIDVDTLKNRLSICASHLIKNRFISKAKHALVCV